MNHGDCMKIRNPIASHIVRNEETVSSHINVLAHYSDDALIDKSGKLVRIFKLTGLNHMTQDRKMLDVYKQRRNNLLKSFSSEFAFYFWEIKRRADEYPEGDFAESYACDVNEQYRVQMRQAQLFHTEHYIAVITKQPEGLINRGFTFLQTIKASFDKQSKLNLIKHQYQELNDATSRIMSAFSEYECELLSVYENDSVKYSAPLEMLSQLTNIDGSPVPLAIKQTASILPRKRLSFNGRTGSIEIRAADNKKQFAAILSIKTYTPHTYQGILDELQSLRCEYTITQSFRFYDRQTAKNKLRDQQNEMLQTRDESITQTEQIDEAFDEAASGEVGFGKHHFSLVCYSNSTEELDKNVGVIASRFLDANIICVRETVACEMTFWAQLPGNFAYICRAADISTLNMASLASLHNLPIGKCTGNHWGDAVTVFETPSGTPYYFNFHYRDVGNFLVFGAMGSGKTALIGFLILQSMKFGGKRVIFDKDRGMELVVRAMRGVYETIKPGKPTGFNPCQLADTSENRQFLVDLFIKILSRPGEVLSESEMTVITSAIEGMYRLAPENRQFCHIASFFGSRKPGSLRTRFDQWHGDGAYAWLFDHSYDTLNLNTDVIGFDISHLLDHPECKTPALMYLTYRVEQALIGKRGMIFFDEGWRVLDDEYFKAWINDLSRTPRKKDNIFGLATQVANDTVNYSISKAIYESAFCKFFFPNPGADRTVYVDHLGLTEYQYQLIKKMPDDEHYFLLVHGRGQHTESVIARPKLKGMQDLLTVLSARERSLLLFDQICPQVGDDPDQWLPVLLQRLRESA